MTESNERGPLADAPKDKAAKVADVQVKRTFAEKAARILFLFALSSVVLFAAYTWVTLKFTYASGDRAGFVQKLSKKGWICKTWEGELAMVNLPGAASEKFLFTVPDEKVAAQINNHLGKKVALEYEQRVGVPSSCFGDTPYFVQAVRVIEP